MPRNIPTYTTCAAPGVARSHETMGGLSGFLVALFYRINNLTTIPIEIRGVGVIVFLAAILSLMALTLSNSPFAWTTFGAAIIVALTEVKSWYYNGRLLCIRDRDCAIGTVISEPGTHKDGDRSLNLMLAPYTQQDWLEALLDHIKANEAMLTNDENFDDPPFHTEALLPLPPTMPILLLNEDLKDYMEDLRAKGKIKRRPKHEQVANMYRQLLIGVVDRLMEDPEKNFYNRYYRKDATVIPTGSALWNAIPEDFDPPPLPNWRGPNAQSKSLSINPYTYDQALETLNPMFEHDISLLVPYLHCEIEGYRIKLIIDNLILAFSTWLAALIAVGLFGGPTPLDALFIAFLIWFFKMLFDRWISNEDGKATEPDIDWENPDASPQAKAKQRVGDVVVVYGNWIMDTEHYQYFEIHPVRAYYILAIDSQTEELVTLNSNKEQKKLQFVNADVTQIDRATADKRCKIITSAEEDAPSAGIERSAEIALSYGMQTRYAGGGAQQEVVG